MAGTLYTYPDNFKAQKVLIASKYSNSAIKVVQNEPEFVMGVTNASEEFLQKFPLGKVPAYESGDTKLTESNAIAYHVGNEQTRGGELEAFVLEWIGFADSEILPHACNWVYPTMGITQYNKQTTEDAKNAIKKALTVLNNHLSARTWLVGERVSQADISVVCTLLMLYKNVLEPSFRQPYTNVNRWFVTAVNQPHFKSVLGDVKLCEKMAQFDSKKYNEIHSKGSKKTPKKPADSGDGKKKQQPKKETPPPTAQQAAKVVKGPWDHLPPTNYDMDQFKKVYSNNDGDVSIPYFWETFNKELYSIWFMKYKFNEDFDGAADFLVSNHIRGMTQRLDKLRKHAFGSCVILKTEKGFDIEGVWFWRGHDLTFKLSDNWQVDYEYYDWQKLDPDCETTKPIVKKYFEWEGDFDGRECTTGEIFK